jgi:predicted NUDIX family NTP pyrophosphohydrolase
VLLAHPGGPLWAHRDDGAWSIPKGEIDHDGDSPLDVARREFKEETGQDAPADGFVTLGEIRQAGGKVVMAWAAEGDIDPDSIESNTFDLEWPPKSGRMLVFPEVDRVAWVEPEEARRRLNRAQVELVDRLIAALEAGETAG